MERLEDGQAVPVELLDGARDAAGDVEQAAARRDEQVVRARRHLELRIQMPVGRIDLGDVGLAHQPDQELVVVPQHAGWRAADGRGPEHAPGCGLDGDQLAGVLQAHIRHRRVGRVVDVARHGGGRDPVQQRQGGGVVDVDLVAREPGHGQVAAVGAVLQLVGVRHRHVPLQRAGLGVEKEGGIAGGVADHQRAAVRGQGHVVRLAQHRDAADLPAGRGVELADRGVGGIEHEGDPGGLRRCQRRAGGAQGQDCGAAAGEGLSAHGSHRLVHLSCAVAATVRLDAALRPGVMDGQTGALRVNG